MFPNLKIHIRNPNFPSNLLILSNRLSQLRIRSLMASTTKIVAEYAKSNRSFCKKCSETSPAKSLRLGLVTRDQRGFDATKWHHLNCLSQPIRSVESVSEFSLLQSDDQEALKKLEASSDGSEEKEGNEEEEEKVKEQKKSRKRTKVSKEEEIEDVGGEEKSSKKLKDEGLHDSSKIAAFDFDGCLAKTSLKRIGPDAWSLMYSSIPEKLKSLYDDGYKLVIFPNESNIDRWKNKRKLAVNSEIGRLNNFIKRVNVPIQEDLFRKPRPGMWRIMEQHFNSDITIDMDQYPTTCNCCWLLKKHHELVNSRHLRSFYVGDAAGRVDDHSDADIKFARAIGLKFHVPEDYFAL